MGKLVLSRKVGESIDIYDPASDLVIVVTVSSVRGNKSSIAIDAPTHLEIKRSELAEKGGAK